MSRFDAVVSQLGLSPEVRAELVTRYGEPHRRYHNLDHLEEVLTGLDGSAPEILLAALFHDAVYDPTRSDNEARSADLMRALVPTASERAVDAILATQTHVTDDPKIALLLDADLAVLGRDTPGYRAYAEAIREEYRHVPEEAYRRGRARVLLTFLERERIYRTAHFRPLEAPARANLKAEIQALVR